MQQCAVIADVLTDKILVLRLLWKTKFLNMKCIFRAHKDMLGQYCNNSTESSDNVYDI